MKFKFPNYLTIGRIIIVPIFVFAFYLPGFYGDVIPFALFVIASFTDFLDGLLAIALQSVLASYVQSQEYKPLLRNQKLI